MSQSYPNFLTRAVASILSLAIVLILMATIFGNTVQAVYRPMIASGGAPLLLFGGMLLMALAIAHLYPKFKIDVSQNWFLSAVQFAVPMSLSIFFFTHMIQVGYTTLSLAGWLLEGLYDSTGPMAAIITLAWLTHRENKFKR